MVFPTSHLAWSPVTVCDLYRCRWEIGVFFKQLKQTVQRVDFLGNSANAVKWQVWTALPGHLLLRFLAWREGWAHSFTRLFTHVRAALWLRRDLAELLRRCGTAPGPAGPACRPSRGNSPGLPRCSWDSMRELCPVKHPSPLQSSIALVPPAPLIELPSKHWHHHVRFLWDGTDTNPPCSEHSGRAGRGLAPRSRPRHRPGHARACSNRGPPRAPRFPINRPPPPPRPSSPHSGFAPSFRRARPRGFEPVYTWSGGFDKRSPPPRNVPELFCRRREGSIRAKVGERALHPA